MGVIGRLAKVVLPWKYHYTAEHMYLYLRGSVEFYERPERGQFIRKAFRMLSFNGIPGDYVEFGCCGGGTFRQAFSESRRHGFNCQLWAFDSFEGLPAQSLVEDRHPRWQRGDMKTSLETFHAICENHGMARHEYSVVPGFYDETIGASKQYAGPLPAEIAFAYIDCDLYSSTKTVMDFLGPRLKHGTLIALDDYFCYDQHELSGERRASLEFLTNHPNLHFSPYLPFGWHGMSFIVEDRTLFNGMDPTLLP